MKNDEPVNAYLGVQTSGRFKKLHAAPTSPPPPYVIKSTMPRILTFLDAQPGGSQSQRGGIGRQQQHTSYTSNYKRRADDDED